MTTNVATARLKHTIVTADDAIRRVCETFPFPGYTDGQVWAYRTITLTAARYLRPGARILDFGCGPCDKTAVLQLLGFACAGYDELADPWHTVAEHRQQIMQFIRDQGIDFRLATPDEPIPFAPDTFDMVMMHDVLEHLHDSPRQLLNALVTRIVPGGYFFATVPSAVNIRKRLAVACGRTNLPPFADYYWHPGSWRGHVREYTRGDLLALAGYLDIDVVELRSCNHMLGKVPSRIRPASRNVATPPAASKTMNGSIGSRKRK
jgi:SAM-dependent methyltransferase